MKKGAVVEWFSSDAAAEYCGFPSSEAFVTWIRREEARGTLRIPVYAIGGRLRFRRVHLDALAELLQDAQIGPSKVVASRPALSVVGGRRR